MNRLIICLAVSILLVGCSADGLRAAKAFVDGWNEGMGNARPQSSSGTMDAYLTGFSGGMSVTGQAIVSCKYSVGSTSFVRNFPSGTLCPSKVPVQ